MKGRHSHESVRTFRLHRRLAVVPSRPSVQSPQQLPPPHVYPLLLALYSSNDNDDFRPEPLSARCRCASLFLAPLHRAALPRRPVPRPRQRPPLQVMMRERGAADPVQPARRLLGTEHAPHVVVWRRGGEDHDLQLPWLGFLCGSKGERAALAGSVLTDGRRMRRGGERRKGEGNGRVGANAVGMWRWGEEKDRLDAHRPPPHVRASVADPVPNLETVLPPPTCPHGPPAKAC